MGSATAARSRKRNPAKSRSSRTIRAASAGRGTSASGCDVTTEKGSQNAVRESTPQRKARGPSPAWDLDRKRAQHIGFDVDSLLFRTVDVPCTGLPALPDFIDLADVSFRAVVPEAHPHSLGIGHPPPRMRARVVP